MNVTYACKETDMSFKTLAPQQLFHSHCFSVFVYSSFFQLVPRIAEIYKLGKFEPVSKKFKLKKKFEPQQIHPKISVSL